jgi:hypothetical protein
MNSQITNSKISLYTGVELTYIIIIIIIIIIYPEENIWA